MKPSPYLVASVGTQLRVTRGLAMPQLRGGNGRSQEYLAFLLPLLHNGGRTRRRPQTRSRDNLPSQSMTILGKYWNVAEWERRLRGWLKVAPASHVLLWHRDKLPSSLVKYKQGIYFWHIETPLTTFYWNDEFKDTETGFVHSLHN